MANYAALKTEIALPAYNGMADAQIIAAVNAKTVTAPQPAVLNVPDIINAIVPADFTGLTQIQLSQMMLLLGGAGTVNASPGTTIRAVFQNIFAAKATTLANLGALVAPFDNATAPWAATVVGIAAISQPDLNNARAS